MATGQRDLRVVLGELARELAAPDPDEITARHDLDALRAEVRAKQPSAPEINVTIQQAPASSHKRDRSDPPSVSELSIQVSRDKKLRVTGGVAVVIVAVLLALMAGLWLVMR